MSAFENNNPLLAPWNTPFELPPFTEIKAEHYEPAFRVAFEAHKDDIRRIVDETAAPTFENTVATFDRSGGVLDKVSRVFDNLCSSNCPPELQEVQLKMAGPVAAHSSSIYMFPGLFEKIDAVYKERHSSSLNSEQIRLVERIHLDFVRSGAKFDQEAKEKYAKIVETLAELTTKFTQNVMADESKFTIPLESEADFAGLPNDLIEAAKQAAEERRESGVTSPAVVTLSRSLVEPFLVFSERRDLREKAWKAWTRRGELVEERDNRVLIVEILKLREEQAKMHGYATYADFATADTMAGNPEAVMGLLKKAWEPAKISAARERDAMLEYIASTGDTSIDQLEPWDWRHYAEKVRKSRYDLDESELKPYFTLDRMVEAIFDCANKLFGLRFVPRDDIVAYHPDVKTYEVHETDAEGQDRLVAIFLHDNFARTNKQSGAWMSEYRSQSRNGSNNGSGENVVPIIVNNNNFAKGDPTLLSFDDAKTLFHEFGHGLHGMLSNVTYQRLAGTNVLRDFVELPSQLYEHWLSENQVLKTHARHFQSGEPIPDQLLDRLMKAKKFNQGFETVEYTSSALVDQALHKLSISSITTTSGGGGLDVTAFEAEELERLGMPREIVMRHRPAHFQHLFSGSSYAAGYYVYMWAEVLDADGFDAFVESGDIFDAATAQRLRQHIYSAGNSCDPAEAYRRFRGRDPVVEPMLKKRGLLN